MKSKTVFFPILFAICMVSCSSNNSNTEAAYSDGYSSGYQDGYVLGYTQGTKDGQSTGYVSGYQDGFNNGTEAGYSEGYEEGYEDGSQSSGEDLFVRPGNNLSFHTTKQQSYLDDADPANIGKYATGASGQELSSPNSVHVDWSDFRYPQSINSYTFVLSETFNFDKHLDYNLSTKNIDLHNLKLGTKYYWYLSANGTSTTYNSPVFSFTTKSDIVRNLKVPYTTNWRDLGNYLLSNNKRIKQGLLYRSAAFGFLNGTTSAIQQETKDCILNELQIKTNIDLATTESITGMNYVNARMEYSGISNLIADSGNQASIKTVFNSLGVNSNYPAVFHCTRGRDRTGAIAFLVGAYLGMSIKDLYRDYLFTNFSADNACGITVIKEYESYLKGYAGSTLQEQTTNYLLGIGISQSTLTNIQNILVG